MRNLPLFYVAQYSFLFRSTGDLFKFVIPPCQHLYNGKDNYQTHFQHFGFSLPVPQFEVWRILETNTAGGSGIFNRGGLTLSHMWSSPITEIFLPDAAVTAF